MTGAPRAAGAVGIVVPGLLGRMGRLVALAALDDDRCALVGATLRAAWPDVGEDVGRPLQRAAVGARIAPTLDAALAQVGPTWKGRLAVVDFTTAGSTVEHAAACRRHGAALVVGTTGFSSDDRAALDAASAEIPVLVAANMSVGAHLVAALAARATAALPGADVVGVELHHRKKRDAPSGTALLMAGAVARARGAALEDVVRTARAGEAPRTAGEIGVLGVRGGDVVGEHTVYFFLDGERVELTHRVTDRRIFATGALAAACALVGRAAGYHAIEDVLGL